MTFWNRVRSIFGKERAVAEEQSPVPAEESPAPVPIEPPPSETIESSRVDPLESAFVDAPDEGALLTAFDALAKSGRELRAIELARLRCDVEPRNHRLAIRASEAVFSRGDVGGAFDILRPVLSERVPPIAALMLAGEISEHRGDLGEALAFYERVLARDVDYPRARERVIRLREARERPAGMAGATLLADGAMARGRYRIQHELGRGGAGTVFAATDVNLDRTVALKIYHRHGRGERARLRIEGVVPARLEHPGIIRIFDLDEHLNALSMEWLAAGGVRSELRKGATTRARAHRWLATTFDAVAFIHEAGWVHRDLKPSNFLLREDDRVVLTDFGLAAPIHTASSMPEADGGQGTLAYMAPEQRAGAAPHPAADIHALGATMLEIFEQLEEDIDDEWIELARACMRRDPMTRPSLDRLRAAFSR